MPNGQTEIVVPPPETPKSKRWILIIAIIVSTVFILVLFSGLIFLKKIQVPILNQAQPQLEKSPKIQILCPTVAEFCQKPKEVLENGRYAGIGSNVEAGSPIFAVFDGQIEIRGVSGPGVGDEEFVQVTIRNDQQKLRALYSVKYIEKGKGTMVSLPLGFKKGDTIATVSAEPIAYYGNYNLVFQLTDERGEAIPFEKISFY